MNKQDYVNLLHSKPWVEIDQHFGNMNLIEPQYVTKIDVDSQQWIDFSVDYFNDALQMWEEPRPHYDQISKWLAEKNVELGRGEGNSFELNYGINGSSGEVLKELLGSSNIDQLGLCNENLLVRLIVNLPGNGVAWHFDSAGRYKQKYNNVDFEKNTVVRYWFSVTDWCYGQVFQIGPRVLSHWQSGDVWHIPFGVPHGSMNFGYNIKYTVAITGTIK